MPPRTKSVLQSIVMLAWILPDVVVGFAWFAYLDSEGFRQLCDRLRGESDIHNTGE